jgi:hypothetical protein
MFDESRRLTQLLRTNLYTQDVAHSGAGQPGRNNNHRLNLMVLYPNERLQFYFGINRLRKGDKHGSGERSENPRFCKVV